MNPVYVLDLFSGIGGFSRAFSAASDQFQTIAFSEIDPYACAVLAHRFPGIPNLGPVQNITRDSIIERTGCLPTVITGGFPCQPHSVAGLRKSNEDERDLWHECARIICELRPRFALFENVGGLLTSADVSRDGDRAKGFFLNRIMSDLAAIRYACIWQIIPASAVGAPHRRDRVWLLCVDELANSNGTGLQRRREPGESDAPWKQKRDDQQPMRRRGDGGETIWPARPGQPQFDWEPPRQIIPRLDRDADGLPARMDPTANRVPRLKALGNSIVPQVAEVFARAILHTINPHEHT